MDLDDETLKECFAGRGGSRALDVLAVMALLGISTSEVFEVVGRDLPEPLRRERQGLRTLEEYLREKLEESEIPVESFAAEIDMDESKLEAVISSRDVSFAWFVETVAIMRTLGVEPYDLLDALGRQFSRYLNWYRDPLMTASILSEILRARVSSLARPGGRDYQIRVEGPEDLERLSARVRIIEALIACKNLVEAMTSVKSVLRHASDEDRLEILSFLRVKYPVPGTTGTVRDSAELDFLRNWVLDCVTVGPGSKT